MEKIDIVKSITERTGGELYLGVVGAVRTGKSTFIKKFIENLVVPNIEDEYERKSGGEKRRRSRTLRMPVSTLPMPSLPRSPIRSSL